MTDRNLVLRKVLVDELRRRLAAGQMRAVKTPDGRVRLRYTDENGRAAEYLFPRGAAAV